MYRDSEPWKGWGHVRDTSRRYPPELKERAAQLPAMRSDNDSSADEDGDGTKC